MQAPKPAELHHSRASSATLGTRRCCHRCAPDVLEPHELRCSISRPRSAFDRNTSTQYPIGWIHQHLRRLPTFGVGLSAHATPSPLLHDRRCPTRQVSFAVYSRRLRREPILADPALRKARVPRSVALSRVCLASRRDLLTTRFVELPKEPSEPVTSPACSLGCRARQWFSGAVDVSPRLERPSMVLAAPSDPTKRRHNPTEPKLCRTASRPLRGTPATNRRCRAERRNCRLETTESPQCARPEGVATIVPASTREKYWRRAGC